MLFQDTLSTAMKGVTVNKTRSALTMLGIIIGVGSVVLMVSIGRSFQNYILTQVESYGTTTLDVFPVGLEKFGGSMQSLTMEDFEAISRLSTVENATPIIIVGKSIEYGTEKVSPMTMGTYKYMLENNGLKIEYGRLLEDADERGAKNVVVIGPDTAEDLFGDSDPLGKNITIGSQSFSVIGVLEPQGSALASQLDSMVFMPFSAAKALTGQKYLSYITLKAVGDPALTKQDVTELLRARHHIDNPENDPDKDDFVARSAEQVTGIISSVTLGLTVFLSLVAAISLIVGGIGIMNIMLVSVTERTREIGLRKAVGAKRRDIMLQFLLEAVALTLSGGFIGILGGMFLGWVMSLVANKLLGEFSFALSFWAIFLAVMMAVGTGLIFGLYPAKRAAGLSPMEALRYE